MAIVFTAPARSRERLVLFGMEGVGKTSAAWQIALRTNAKTIWYVETDNTADEFAESEQYADVGIREEWVNRQRDTTYYNNSDGRVVLLRVRSWEEYVWAMEKAFKEAERDDWIVIDNQSNMWTGVQDWYVVNAYGKSSADFALEVRKKQIANNEKGTVSQEQFTDWGAINPQYNEHVRRYILNPPCHILMLAMQKPLDDKERDKEAKATFGPYGVKPVGQKAIGQDARTVLLLTKDKRFSSEKYLLTSCKDREREKLDAAEWGDFVGDYLVKVGKWKPTVRS